MKNPRELRMVTVVKDPSVCSDCLAECAIANDEFPDLIPEVSDECDNFIVDPSNMVFWPADHFFSYHRIRTLVVDAKELDPGAPIKRR